MYTYKVEVISVYDGDTLTAIVDLGFNIQTTIKVRLARINTPEIRNKDLVEKARGYEARDFLRQLVEEYKDDLYIETTGKGKYGRWVGEILVGDLKDDTDARFYRKYDDKYHNVNDTLVKAELAEYKEY